MAVSPRGNRRLATPTLSDVASAAGVSLATASRVINGSSRVVADAFRDRVLSAAAELGYTANLAAQATARGTSSTVSLLVADIADPYFAQIAAGVVRAADELDLTVTISVTGRDEVREGEIIRALRGQRPHTLIIATSRSIQSEQRGSADLQALIAANCRVVLLGRGEGGESVALENFGGARSLGRMMADLGFARSIALSSREGIFASDDRVAGFSAGFESGGGRVTEVIRGAFTRESGYAAMMDALSRGVPQGTLVFAVSDVIALGAMTALKDAGRQIGDDVAICGFDDIPMSADIAPGLTTVHVPLEALGYSALRTTAGDHAPAGASLHVIVRDSTPRVRTSVDTLARPLTDGTKEVDHS